MIIIDVHVKCKGVQYPNISAISPKFVRLSQKNLRIEDLLSSINEAEICAIVFTVFLVIAMVWSIVPNARKPHMQTVLSLIHFMKLIHSCKISNALMGIDVGYTCPLLI